MWIRVRIRLFCEQEAALLEIVFDERLGFFNILPAKEFWNVVVVCCVRVQELYHRQFLLLSKTEVVFAIHNGRMHDTSTLFGVYAVSWQYLPLFACVHFYLSYFVERLLLNADKLTSPYL